MTKNCDLQAPPRWIFAISRSLPQYYDYIKQRAILMFYAANTIEGEVKRLSHLKLFISALLVDSSN